MRERPRVAAASAVLLVAIVALSGALSLALGGGDSQTSAERDQAIERATERTRELRTARRQLERSRSAVARSQARVKRLERRQRRAAQRERRLRRALRRARRDRRVAGL